MKSNVTDLERIFQALGAEDPADWASSQINEGIPQLHRYLFLKKAWSLVIGEEDDSWIEEAIEAWGRNPDAPYSGQGRALEKMIALGVERSSIVDLVRAAQAEMIFGICYQLNDPSLSNVEEELVGDIGWTLVKTDDDYEPTSEVIDSLHESVLDLDPTGREMRPRLSAKQ